jgi:hypothetical protein
MGVAQALKIAALREMSYHLPSSAFLPQCPIEAMTERSEEIALQIEYWPVIRACPVDGFGDRLQHCLPDLRCQSD